MELLNLGCGNHYHPSWVNIDFYSIDPNVIRHNLLKGIPFPNNNIDFLYSSHLLEHFTRKDADYFISECFRVLKPGAIMRIVVPDLQKICKEYINIVNEFNSGNFERIEDYNWIMLEMYDQTVRTSSGGEMGKYLAAPYLKNKDFIVSRIGYEAKNYWNIINSKKNSGSNVISINKIFWILFNKIKSMYYKILLSKTNFNYLMEGKFRNSGQIHKWMYDFYSLSFLLKKNNFINIKEVNAFSSNLKDFNKYGLDTIKGDIRKPDSVFIECIKPQSVKN